MPSKPDMSKMAMTLSFSAKVGHLLFDEWAVNKSKTPNGMYILFMFLIFASGWVVNLLHNYSLVIGKKDQNSGYERINSSNAHLLTNQAHGANPSTTSITEDEDGEETTSIGGHLKDQLVFALIKTFNYTFMLVAMSYNYWYIVAIVSGLASSEFAFSVLRDRDYIAKTNANIASGKICKDNLIKK
tara:strand:- start:9 stop:566 length:558 start_codon:yes stop_codon:yes gene_type:complete